MPTYLLTWNPIKFAWDTLQKDWEMVNSGADYEERWSCGNSKKPRVGDRVFFMVLGSKKLRGIMASGYITRGSFEETHWNENAAGSTTHYINFRYDVFLNLE